MFAGGGDGSSADGAGPSGGPTPPPKIACEGQRPPAPDPQRYEEAPEMGLERGVDYGAIISTSCGDVTLDLLEDKAPQNVNNFIFLAEEGFYDGLTFHRIERNSIIQGGDPDGTGGGGPGYTVPDELPPNPTKYLFGTVAMANDGPNTAGSQFFIVVHDNPATKEPDPAGYRPWYSIFGQIDLQDEASMQTLEKIAAIPTKIADDPSIATQPVSTVYIESVEITES